MAYTAEEITAKIEALEAAFERQSRTVQFADRAVTYKSFDEIAQQIRYWQTKLARLNGRPRQWRAVATRGF